MDELHLLKKFILQSESTEPSNFSALPSESGPLNQEYSNDNNRSDPSDPSVAKGRYIS